MSKTKDVLVGPFFIFGHPKPLNRDIDEEVWLGMDAIEFPGRSQALVITRVQGSWYLVVGRN